MKYLSTFSGIEAATVAWHPLGWEPVGFSEIEPFPSAVLKHHYPDVKNYGDITKFKEWDLPPFDLLVGGSPCQSFSVAGLRKGLEDPRGNLMLTFLALADKHKPNWIVWENVPGVLSSNDGKDFECFLDGLEEIKYICDVEILDAQNFGVAQRRRRVFVCGQSVDSIRSRKTSSSGLTIIQCLLEISQAILVEMLSLYGRGPVKSEQASLSRDGVKRRMRLFDLLTENCAYQTWRNLLVEMFLKSVPVRKNWDLPSGGKTEKELTLEDLLMGSSTESRCTLTEQSLNEALDGVYDLMKLYTTSTLTRETIQTKICLFFRIEEAIGRLTCRLSGLSPNSSSAMSSFLTFSQELTNYARQASGELFNELEGIHEVFDILRKANAKETALGNIGDWGDSCQVLFDPHCMSGHPAPSREKGKGTASFAAGGIGSYGEGVGTLRANGGDLGGGSETLISTWWDGGDVASTLTKANANGAQRMPDKDNFGGVLVPRAFKISDQNQQVAQPITYDLEQVTAPHNKQSRTPGDPCHTLGKGNTGRTAVVRPMAINTKQQSQNIGENIANTLGANDYKEPQAIMHQMAVRRLTPREAERLQGFSDDYTAIPWKNKPADQCPDGPRYKALGNSMAVPVMRWIGERIQAVEELMKEIKQ